MGGKPKILIVDDDEGIRDSFSMLLKKDYKVEVADNPESASKVIKADPDGFSVVIIDMWMDDNREAGIDLIKTIKGLNPFIESVVLTSHGDIQNAGGCMEAGAFFYVEKGKGDTNTLLEGAIKRACVYRDVRKKNLSLHQNLVSALIDALGSRDGYTCFHSKNVHDLVKCLFDTAVENSILFNYINDKAGYKEKLLRAAILHDIGKIFIPAKILLKPDRLTPEETVLMQVHPQESVGILKTIELSDEEKEMIQYHHTWYLDPKENAPINDEVGKSKRKGYPKMVKQKDEVTPGVWLIGIADAFDAMTTRRSYKSQMCYIQPMKVIFNEHEQLKNENDKNENGIQFHPDAIRTFFLCREVLEKHLKVKYEADPFNQQWNEIFQNFNCLGRMMESLYNKKSTV